MHDRIKRLCTEGIRKYGIVSFKDMVLASKLSDEVKASIMGVLLPLYDAMANA